jgi:membrane protein
MAIGAQGYTALFPLLIVYASVLPRSGNQGFADMLVGRFDLSGSAAAGVRQAFAPAGDVESGATLLG